MKKSRQTSHVFAPDSTRRIGALELISVPGVVWRLGGQWVKLIQKNNENRQNVLNHEQICDQMYAVSINETKTKHSHKNWPKTAFLEHA